MKSFTNFFIGLLTAFFIALIMGQINSFYSFLLISVICTAGVTLIIWIPVFCMVGHVVRNLFELFTGIKPKPLNPIAEVVVQHHVASSIEEPSIAQEAGQVVHQKTTELPMNSQSLAAIADYMIQARAAGLIDQVIMANLLAAGWTESDVSSGFEAVGGMK